MEIIKRKILLEDYISRNPDKSYGTLTASSLYVKILLTQSFDDLGMFTDINFTEETPSYEILLEKLYPLGVNFPFMLGVEPPILPFTSSTVDLRLRGSVLEDYLVTSNRITGFTDSKIERLKTYNNNTPYISGFDVIQEEYRNFTDTETINGVSRVTSLSNPTAYTFDVNFNDSNIGSYLQTDGIVYNDTDNFRSFRDSDTGDFKTIRETNFSFQGQGFNQTNTSLSAITKEEIFLGIVFPPEIQSDVFIDRGSLEVYSPHLRLSEVESIDHLIRYGNGFYNIIKQI